jgi:EAL domain-containing protein (putative c-di-GMP-specific phosphodiesterase class I)
VEVVALWESVRLTCRVATNAELVSDLSTALSRGQIFAAFQPQIDLADGSIAAAEVLCRWQHPTHGLVPPDRFIPLAEETGAIGAIGRAMLDHGIRALEVWRGRGLPIEISVNVSPVQLSTGDLVGHLAERIEEHPLPTGSLTVEVTETLPLSDLADAVSRLRSLRDLGIGVALDDFGSGHASPRHLEQLPITEVKLDRTLIQSTSESTWRDLAERLRGARARNLRVVAEGVETLSHLKRAKELLCDRAQGFLLGRPMDYSALDALLVGTPA